MRSFRRTPWLTAPLLFIATAAHAQSLNLPIVTDLACKVVGWMQGPLAVLIFLFVTVATLVIGMVGQVDWSRIVSTCVIFGVIMALGRIFADSGLQMLSVCIYVKP